MVLSAISHSSTVVTESRRTDVRNMAITRAAICPRSSLTCGGSTAQGLRETAIAVWKSLRGSVRGDVGLRSDAKETHPGRLMNVADFGDRVYVCGVVESHDGLRHDFFGVLLMDRLAYFWGTRSLRCRRE